MTKVIAVVSHKGGVGKTTTAINLSAFFHHAGKLTLLVDLDPQANATSGVGVKRSTGNQLRALLRNEGSWENCVVPTPLRNLSLVPSFSDPHECQSLDNVDSALLQELRDGLNQQSPPFDYVIIDCPPAFGELDLVAIQLADSILIPVQCEYYAMEGLSQILPLIERVARSRPRSLEIEGLLLTMFCANLELSHEVAQEVREHFPDQTFAAIIPRDVALAEATSHGLPICHYDLRSRGAWAYLKLAKEILDHEAQKAG